MNWVSEDYVTEEGKPIGIGGDPRGATAEKAKEFLKLALKSYWMLLKLSETTQIEHPKLYTRVMV